MLLCFHTVGEVWAHLTKFWVVLKGRRSEEGLRQGVLGAYLSCRGRCIQRKPLHLKDREKNWVLMREGFVERSWCFRTDQFSHSGPGWLLKSRLSGDIRQTQQRNISPWSHWLTPLSWVQEMTQWGKALVAKPDDHSEFRPQDPHGRRREPLPPNRPLTSRGTGTCLPLMK